MFSVSKGELTSSMGLTLKLHIMEEEEGGGGGGQQASCLVAKQAVEFPQVLASIIIQVNRI